MRLGIKAILIKFLSSKNSIKILDAYLLFICKDHVRTNSLPTALVIAPHQSTPYIHSTIVHTRNSGSKSITTVYTEPNSVKNVCVTSNMNEKLDLLLESE